jgi:hypothetical protein
MKKMIFIFLVAFVSLTGCASLTPEGRKVRLASQVGSECEFIGSIDGSIWVNNGDNHLKNQAAEMGGNWVVVTGYRWEGAFTGSKPSSGEVYRCPEMSGSARRVDKAIDLNVNSTNNTPTSNSKNQDDVYVELKKLKQLKDDGIITEDEFNKKKKALLDKM